MAQDLDLSPATGLSFSLSALLGRMQTEQPGAPLAISSTQKAEAERALAAIEAALQPAPQALALRWISALGTLTASKPGEADGFGAGPVASGAAPSAGRAPKAE